MRINNKKILLVIVAILIVILIIILVTTKNKNSKTNTNNSIINANLIVHFENVENDIYQAIEKCNQEYNEYKEFGSEYFSLFFNNESINKYLEKGRLSNANHVEGDIAMIKFYDGNKKEIEEFPENISTDEGPDVEKVDTPYLIKYKSDGDSNNYYYLLTINNEGTPRFEFVCFTVGETSMSDVEIELENI